MDTSSNTARKADAIARRASYSSRFFRRSVLLAAMPLLLQSAFAQGTETDFPVCSVINNQETPHAVSDGSGGSIIMWRDSRSSPDRIYAQRLDGNGVPQWADNGVLVATGGSFHHVSPIGIPDGEGGAIIVWREQIEGGDIHAQRLDASGTILWGSAGVPVCTASSNQSNAALISDGAGGAIITWDDSRSSLDLTNIYAQHISSAGAPQWAANGIAVTMANKRQVSPRIVPDTAGGAIIVWEDERNGFSDIYAQRISESGTLLWPESDVAICTDTLSQVSPQVVIDGAGGAIIGWEDSRVSGAGSAIYAQRINGSGTVLWNAGGIAITTATFAQRYPKMISTASHDAIITFEESGDGTGADVRAQKIDGSGVRLWTDGGVTISNNIATQQLPQITYAPSDGAYIAWLDNRDGESGYDLYTQLLDQNGAAQWPSDGVAINATPSAGTFHIAPLNAGGIVATWDFGPFGNFDVYADYATTAEGPSAAVEGWELFQ